VFWPTIYHFSPDDTHLVCAYYLQLYVVDIASGGIEQLEGTADNASYPDWSPDGFTILYDSGLILHKYDLRTHTDQTIRPDTSASDDTVYVGKDPLWSPDGSHIAFIQSSIDHSNIAVIDSNGSHYHVLDRAAPLTLYDELHWYRHQIYGDLGLVFYQSTNPGAGSYFVSLAGSGKTPFIRNLGFGDSFSPDGAWVAQTDVDRTVPATVISLRRVDDLSGATRRQITFWSPPLP
jgi:Tol biopolymer transport system component